MNTIPNVHHYTAPGGAKLDLCVACALAFPAPLTLARAGGPGLTCQHCLDHNPDPAPAVALPVPVFYVSHPDARLDILPWPQGEDAQGDAIREALGGGLAERVPEPFHTLTRHEVWVDEEGWAERENLPASHMIGMNLRRCAPLLGRVVIVPLPVGQDNAAEREHQRRFFADLAAGRTPEGYDFVIDAREDA